MTKGPKEEEWEERKGNRERQGGGCWGIIPSIIIGRFF